MTSVAATAEQQCHIFDFGHLRTVFFEFSTRPVVINDGATRPDTPHDRPPVGRPVGRTLKHDRSVDSFSTVDGSLQTVHTPHALEVQLTYRHTEPRPSCMAQAGSTCGLPNQRGL